MYKKVFLLIRLTLWLFFCVSQSPFRCRCPRRFGRGIRSSWVDDYTWDMDRSRGKTTAQHKSHIFFSINFIFTVREVNSKLQNWLTRRERMCWSSVSCLACCIWWSYNWDIARRLPSFLFVFDVTFFLLVFFSRYVALL